MDLTQKDYPEGYRLFYDPSTHHFRLIINSDLGRSVLERLAQSGTLLAHHQASFGLHVDSFSYQHQHWGYGACIHITSETGDTPRMTWSCSIERLTERMIDNITCSLSVLFEALHACMTDTQIPASPLISSQFLTVTTLVQPQITCAYWITSSLSRSARKNLESLAIRGSTEERALFFRRIICSMHDAYHQCLKADSDTPHTTPCMTNCHGASQDLLSVHFCDREGWRIMFECVGASLCIDPHDLHRPEDQGANFQPHNTDRSIHQLTILAGLAACDEYLRLM